MQLTSEQKIKVIPVQIGDQLLQTTHGPDFPTTNRTIRITGFDLPNRRVYAVSHYPNTKQLVLPVTDIVRDTAGLPVTITHRRGYIVHSRITD